MVLALVHAKQNADQTETLLDVVQTSLIGSIFSNSLLVLGCAFVANGYYYKESSFNVTLSLYKQYISSVMVMFIVFTNKQNYI